MPLANVTSKKPTPTHGPKGRREVLQVGDVVCLRPTTVVCRGESHGGTATVRNLYSDIEGGVYLEPMLGGFHSWNEQDLLIVRRVTQPATKTRKRH